MSRELHEELLDAVLDGDIVKVRAFLKVGALPNAIDKYGGPLTFVALESGNKDAEVFYALLKAGANPNSKDQNGYPLIFAAFDYRNRDAEVFYALLKAGANPNSTDVRGNTLLSAIVHEEEIKMIEALLKAGANPNLPNETHWPTIIGAALTRKREIVQLLYAGGCTPEGREKQKITMSLNQLLLLIL